MTNTAKDKLLKRREQFEQKDAYKRALLEADNAETYEKLRMLRNARKAPSSPLANLQPVEFEEEEVTDVPKKKRLTTPDMTKDELYDLGKENDIYVTRAMTKDELIKAIDGDLVK